MAFPFLAGRGAERDGALLPRRFRLSFALQYGFKLGVNKGMARATVAFRAGPGRRVRHRRHARGRT
ncbi:MAG: hypothetical protein FJX19_04360 [Alphaproteobacteria bacterium]|nr:hypothetical protein [Alphaproteobacteria bacterium]